VNILMRLSHIAQRNISEAYHIDQLRYIFDQLDPWYSQPPELQRNVWRSSAPLFHLNELRLVLF
jgi:hypothetical protein